MATRHSLDRCYGNLVEDRHVAGLILTECTYHPELRMPCHWHDYPQFYLILQGACTDTCGSQACLRRPTALVFHPAGEPHANHYHKGGARLFTIEMEPWWLERVPPPSGGWQHPRHFEGGLSSGLALRLYTEFRARDAWAPVAMEGLMLELLAEAFRQRQTAAGGRPPRWLAEAQEILSTRFTQSWSLAHLAQTVGVHPTHLAREFRRYYHCTVGEYLREQRIEQTRRELSHSDAPLADIALAAGFADQSHFSRLFKRRTGLTPSQFRQRFRGR
jgi:AraC family transcriptional regulator